MSKQKRILIDCTFVYTSGLNTGIQRVVRNIASIAKSMRTYEGYDICLVVIEKDRIFEIDTIPDNTKSSLENSVYNYFLNIYYSMRNLLVNIFPFKFFKIFILNKKNRFGLSYILLTPKRLYTHFFNPTEESKNVITTKNDIFILLDSTWDIDIKDSLAVIKNNTTTIITVIYDLIPITHPQFCDSHLVYVFNKWFKNNAKVTNGYLAISETVKDDVMRYLNENNQNKFDSFMLGANVNKKSDTVPIISEKFKDIFQNNNVYIIVSTIEARKNHLYLLKTFEKLWEKNIDVKLCIIGRIGWLVDELLAQIDTHKEKNKRLFMFNDTNDDTLLFAYEHAKALLFPSFTEGFGLPIVESLQKGLPVLASDTPIHREVGKDNIAYFDLSDTNDLVQQIIEIEKNGIPEDLKSMGEVTCFTWEESTRDFLRKSIAITKRLAQ